MSALLRLAQGIDELNRRCAQIAAWLVLVSCLISAGNAVSRYLFNASSNAWLEIQWQMFAGIFLLGSPYVLKLNEHVRVDVIYGGRTDRAKLVIDIFGLLVFFFPAVLFTLYFAWPFFMESFRSGETSSNAGGLILWPVKSLLPVGFSLLALQGVSELIKRCAAYSGSPANAGAFAAYEKPLQ